MLTPYQPFCDKNCSFQLFCLSYTFVLQIQQLGISDLYFTFNTFLGTRVCSKGGNAACKLFALC